MIRISIVIATYNRGPKLLRTLRSLVGQTLPTAEWEAVVVNNNSTDDTPEVFAAFAAAHPELDLRMVSEPRQGLSHARNRGIEASCGPIIAIIDDDEEVNPEFAAAYVDFFDRRPDVAMAGGKVIPRYETARPRWMSRFTERPIAGTLDPGDDEKPFGGGRRSLRRVLSFSGASYPAGGNMAVRRSAFERYGVFDPSLGRTGGNQMGGEEKELFARIATGGEQIWWVPSAVIYHIIPPEKLTLDYFRRLSLGVGASERVRISNAGGAYRLAVIKELLKWVATLAIALFYVVTACPSKARYLTIMRRGISAGLLGGAK